MKPTLTDITGIGPSTAQELADGGIRTVEDLANASPSVICAVPGFGAIRAARIKAAATELIRRSASPAAATVEPIESAPKPDSDSEPETTADDPEPTAVNEEDKPKKKKTGKKDKKDKKGEKGKKDKGKSKKNKADKKGKSRGKKDKKP